MRSLLLFVGLAAVLPGLGGCATTQLPGASPASRLDSLRAENATLRSRLRRVEDSLRFRDDVATGQYYRDLRVLKDRLNRRTYEAQIRRQGGRTVRVLPADSLFESSTATLTAAGKKRLRAMTGHLEMAYATRSVRVEGHADDTPLSEDLQERFASNWELSAARATAVVRYLIAHSALAPSQFAALAYGATDPVASNATARGRRRNRRVRIAVLPPPQDYSRSVETSW
ncbi:OmpA/MotB family protein [Salinibacter grassmerensis]|uniref:OmpA/MotB family protein n=1 Tax=Salinibacter grassmerensis TaxID=3040353 RepID=UPI0021E8D4FD|nr:OmpA family protein [Salinibacter grassmerensis]